MDNMKLSSGYLYSSLLETGVKATTNWSVGSRVMGKTSKAYAGTVMFQQPIVMMSNGNADFFVNTIYKI
jgi:hypothetical protein